MQGALEAAKAAGGTVHGGERRGHRGAADGYYVRPALVEMVAQTGPVEQETFAPILYVMKYSDLDTVLELHNGVAQAFLPRSSPMTCAKPKPSFRRVAPIAALPTSISARPVRKSGRIGGEKETGGYKRTISLFQIDME